MKTFLCALFSLLCFASFAFSDDLILKNKLKDAKPGDYIVTAQGKVYSLIHIYSKEDNRLILEEITVPQSKIPSENFSWRTWVNDNAPGNSSWVLYKINLADGTMSQPYSFTMNRYFSIPDSDNFLSQLLNLKLQIVKAHDRKRVGAAPDKGAPDWRPLWQPPLIVEGQTVTNAFFDAYKAQWPRDGSEMSGKTILVYLPDYNLKVPSYFPYWLEISGLVGKAKVRIVDSGTGLKSPKDENFIRSLF